MQLVEIFVKNFDFKSLVVYLYINMSKIIFHDQVFYLDTRY